jgi:N-acetyl-gamma-glutamyl-phosphate reductase
MIRVGIVGATGYTGAELVRILSAHPDVSLSLLTSRQHVGVAFHKIYPAMTQRVDLVCEAFDYDQVADKVDVVFMALPHKLPMEYVPELLKRGKKVVDLSADFRFADPALYEAAYQPHMAKGTLAKAVYGLAEVFTKEIQEADLIGNPGCYPTSVILPLYPLLKAGYLNSETLIADAKSGVSGAGRSATLTTHYCEVNESFKAYKVGNHRHNPEMNEKLSIAAGKPIRITFVPHLLPISRGMETTIYADLVREVDPSEIARCLADFYTGRPFIRLTENGRPPDTLHVKGTNFCDIGFVIEKTGRRIILMSAIDNLVKGASGQAVQNMNLMMGLDETRGLAMLPFPL